MNISPQKLIDLEEKYGGLQRINQMKGGNRMQYRVYNSETVCKGYAALYSRYIPNNAQVVAELGVLRGTGLAIWADVFPTARIIGLDNDLIHFKKYKSSLRVFGAFKRTDAEVYLYEKFAEDASERLGEILDGDQIDVFIDDSDSSADEVFYVFRTVLPHLAPGAVCFFEDNEEAGALLEELYPNYFACSEKGLTVMII